MRPQFKIAHLMIVMALLAIAFVIYLNADTKTHSNVYNLWSHSRFANDIIAEDSSIKLVGACGYKNGWLTLAAPQGYKQSDLFSDIEAVLQHRFSAEREDFLLERQSISYDDKAIGLLLSWKSRSVEGRLIIVVPELAKKKRHFAGQDMSLHGLSFVISEEIRDKKP